MKCILYIIVILFLFGCYTNKKDVTQQVKQLYGKEIKFHNDNHFIINGKDTILDKLNKGNYKIVFFADSSNCEICDFKLGEWYVKMKEIHYYDPSVNFIFIIQSKDYHTFEHYAQETLPDFPFIYDPQGLFIKQNQLPDDTRFRVFLLNKTNKICLIGSPIGSDKLWDLYKEEILKSNIFSE